MADQMLADLIEGPFKGKKFKFHHTDPSTGERKVMELGGMRVMNKNFFRSLILVLCAGILSSCNEGFWSSEEYMEKGEIPEFCEYQMEYDPDTRPRELIGLTECHKKWLKKVVPMLVFSDKNRVFYKAEYPKIKYQVLGNFERHSWFRYDNSSILPGVGVGLNLMAGNRLRPIKRSKGERYHYIFGVEDIEDFLESLDDIFIEKNFGEYENPRLYIKNQLSKNPYCLYGRSIDPRYRTIRSAVAHVKNTPSKNIPNESLPPSEFYKRLYNYNKSDELLTRAQQKKRDACYLLSFYYYLGAANIYQYMDELVYNGKKDGEKPFFLARTGFIPNLLIHKDLATAVGPKAFKASLYPIIDNLLNKNKDLKP